MEQRGKCGQEGRHQAVLFYADDVMVALLDPHWLRGAFSTLVCLFDRVSLRNNVRKTIGMVCHPFQVAGTQSDAEYGRRMTGEGLTYREQQKVQVQCRERGEEMAAGTLAGYKMTQHGRVAEAIRSWKTSASERKGQQKTFGSCRKPS